VPLRGLIRPVFAACAASDAAQGAKRLSGGRIQATLASEGTTTWGMSVIAPDGMFFEKAR
ncbi:MAG: hypothetical protein O2898_09805, partial [Proteobacteria bacterium]|nr:hypothetical protein [Pseudomonadota bacterium]